MEAEQQQLLSYSVDSSVLQRSKADSYMYNWHQIRLCCLLIDSRGRTTNSNQDKQHIFSIRYAIHPLKGKVRNKLCTSWRRTCHCIQLIMFVINVRPTQNDQVDGLLLSLCPPPPFGNLNLFQTPRFLNLSSSSFYTCSQIPNSCHQVNDH